MGQGRRAVRGSFIAVFIALGCAALPAVASATTFCVPNASIPGCPGGATPQADLEIAANLNAADGTADLVLVGDHDYVDTGTFEIGAGSDALEIRGLNPADTTISTSFTGNAFVVNLAQTSNTRTVTMRNLTILAPATLGNGAAAMQMSNDTLDNVDIEVQNPGSTGVTSILGGGTFRDGEMRTSGSGTITTGFASGSVPGTIQIDNWVIRGTASAILNSGSIPASTMNVRRTLISEPMVAAVSGSRGVTNVENTVITNSSAASGITANSDTNNTVTVNADHVTMLKTSGSAAPPVSSQVQVGAAADATVNVTNSIMRGYSAAYERAAPVLSGGEGNAMVTMSRSNFTVGVPSESGDGFGTLTNNIDANPLFVNPAGFADLRLSPGSPSIDAGAPGQATPTVDFLGNTRPLDGDGNGSAIRDQGAFEAPVPPPPPPDGDGDGVPDSSDSCPGEPGPASSNGCPIAETPPGDGGGGGSDGGAGGTTSSDTTAPQTTIGKGPKAETSSEKANFSFSSSESGSKFECKLDKGKFESCTSPKRYKKLDEGKHKFFVVAIDAAGNRDPSAAVHKWRVEE